MGAERRPRLLVLASTYPRWADDHEPGFVHELARRLVRRFEVVVLTSSCPGAQACEFRDGVRIVRYRYAPRRLESLVYGGGITSHLRKSPWKWLLVPGFIASMMWSVRRLVRDFRPDIIHAHWIVPQGLAIALLSALDGTLPPVVVTSHGADLFTLRGWPFNVLKRYAVRRAAAVTVVSSVMCAEVARLGVSQERIAVVPMGVDLVGRFTPDAMTPRSRDRILFVGRLVAKKGVHHLIDAMAAVVLARPRARLVVAGFGPELPALRDRVQALGLSTHVDFLGPVPQDALPRLYREAALFVAPFVEAEGGDQEGLGLVVVEALGCGAPVIVGDVPAVGDVLVEGGGWRVSAGDTRALAGAIVALLDDEPRARIMADTGREAALARFSWDAVAEKYGDLLKRVARVPS